MCTKEIMVSIHKIKMSKKRKRKKRAKIYSTETSIFSKKKSNGTLDIDVNIHKKKKKKKSLTKMSYRYKKCQKCQHKYKEGVMDKRKEKKSQGKIQSLGCTLGVQLGNLSLYILFFHSPNPAYITIDKKSPH
jgi:hypothetical protein